MAASNVQTLAGSTLSISATLPATHTKVGFDALTFVTVGLIETMPSTGREYTEVTFNPVAERATIRKKGSFNEGNGEIVLAMDRSDAGQVIMRGAAGTDDDYAFKITYQDGSVKYFAATVAMFADQGGGVDDILKVNATIWTQTYDGVGYIEVPPETP